MSAGLRVVVAGAGVFGLASALALNARGASVVLVDPQPGDANASSVAAGLLAPTSEVLFDPVIAPQHELLSAAMALWSGFAHRHGLLLAAEGTVVGADHAPSVSRLGARCRSHPAGLLLQDEMRVADPSGALRSLAVELVRAGGRIETRALRADDLDHVDALVLAAGPGLMGMRGLAPEVRHLIPVKGQIAILPNGPVVGPTLRWPGGYLAPQASGARVGATMEVGRADTTVEAEVIAGLVTAARLQLPDLDIGGVCGQAGVRMQTPDALPLAGPSRVPRTWLAAGARRNGWLLAPLVGSIIAAYCMGEDPGPWAARLDPGRFDRSNEGA